MSRPGPAAKRPSGWEGRVFSPRWICPSSFLAPPNALPAGPARQRAKDVPSRPIRAVAARGGSACALCRHSAVASVTRGESRRRSRRKKSAAVSVLTSSPKIRRAFLARAIGLSSTLHRTVGDCAGRLTPLRGSLRGGLRPLRGVAARALDLRSARLPFDFAALRLIFGASPLRARRPAVALVVGEGRRCRGCRLGKLPRMNFRKLPRPRAGPGGRRCRCLRQPAFPLATRGHCYDIISPMKCYRLVEKVSHKAPQASVRRIKAVIGNRE